MDSDLKMVTFLLCDLPSKACQSTVPVFHSYHLNCRYRLQSPLDPHKTSCVLQLVGVSSQGGYVPRGPSPSVRGWIECFYLPTCSWKIMSCVLYGPSRGWEGAQWVVLQLQLPTAETWWLYIFLGPPSFYHLTVLLLTSSSWGLPPLHVNSLYLNRHPGSAVGGAQITTAGKHTT